MNNPESKKSNPESKKSKLAAGRKQAEAIIDQAAQAKHLLAEIVTHINLCGVPDTGDWDAWAQKYGKSTVRVALQMLEGQDNG